METGVNHLPKSTLSLHHAAAGSLLLCSAMDLAQSEDAPEWIHLLPAGELRTNDGRGPFRTEEAAKLILNSMTAGDRLPIDENHATDLAAPQGQPAPARGWITELQARQDGIWGKVEWTAAGRNLVRSKAYRGISPVLHHRQADMTVFAIRRASLVNAPNLKGLKTLHQESTMDLLAALIAALSLPAETTEEAALAAVKTLVADSTEKTTSLHAIAVAAGLDKAAKPELITSTVTSLQAAQGGDQAGVITSLQSELVNVTNRLNDLTGANKRKDAEAFVDGAINRMVVGVKPLRDHYITRHMANPKDVETEINSLPTLGRSGTEIVPPKAAGSVLTLNAEQRNAARLLGVAEADYLKTLQSEQTEA